MSQGAVGQFAQQVYGMVGQIIRRNSAQNRAFLNFNPTFFSLSNQAIADGLLLNSPDIQELVDKFKQLRIEGRSEKDSEKSRYILESLGTFQFIS